SFVARFKKYISRKNGVVKEDTFFELAKTKFNELGLDSKGILPIEHPETKQLYLAIVDNDKAKIYSQSEKALEKGTNKGLRFKSTVLEKDLESRGIIDTSIIAKTQKLELNQVAEATTLDDGTAIYGIYELVKSTAAESAEDAADDEAENQEEDASQATGLGAIAGNDDF